MEVKNKKDAFSAALFRFAILRDFAFIETDVKNSKSDSSSLRFDVFKCGANVHDGDWVFFRPHSQFKLCVCLSSVFQTSPATPFRREAGTRGTKIRRTLWMKSHSAVTKRRRLSVSDLMMYERLILSGESYRNCWK